MDTKICDYCRGPISAQTGMCCCEYDGCDNSSFDDFDGYCDDVYYENNSTNIISTIPTVCGDCHDTIDPDTNICECYCGVCYYEGCVKVKCVSGKCPISDKHC